MSCHDVSWPGGQDLGLWGLAWGAMLLNGLLFPCASFYMLWALRKTAMALRGERQAHRPAMLGRACRAKRGALTGLG